MTDAGTRSMLKCANIPRIGVVVVSLVVASGVGAGCSANRSSAEFCRTIDATTTSLRENYEKADKDFAGQFGLIASNLGAYTDMVHRLKEVSPKDIRGDMSAASDAWDRQVGLLSNAGSDPVGTLVGGFMVGASANESFKRVDEYALSNCGASVFGSGDTWATSGKLKPSSPTPFSSSISSEATATPRSNTERTWSIPQATVVNREGYSVLVSNVTMSTTPIAVDIANADPGKAGLIPGKLSVTATFTNTTAGRNSPRPPVVIYGMTPVKSVEECKQFGYVYSGFLVSGKTKWCTVYDFNLGEGGDDLSVDETSSTTYKDKWRVPYLEVSETEAQSIVDAEGRRTWLWVMASSYGGDGYPLVKNCTPSSFFGLSTRMDGGKEVWDTEPRREGALPLCTLASSQPLS